MKPLCIYHGNCADGFGAAWAVRQALGADGVDFHAGVYQNEPPDVASRHVIFVDFSYKRDVMQKLAERSAGVLLLDHHKTAMEDFFPDGCTPHQQIQDLREYGGQLTWQRFLHDCYQDYCENIPHGRIYALFDMTRSGAGIAWDFFHPGRDRPELLKRIEDRDLWRFAYPDTRAIQAAVFSYPYEFDVWDMLFKADLSVLRSEGEAIERKHHKDIAELTKVVTRPMKIGGHVVPIANLPYTLTSDAGHLLCSVPDPNGPPGTFVEYPLCRLLGGADVGEIAKQYGGGGHKNASGFRIPFDRAREFECTASS